MTGNINHEESRSRKPKSGESLTSPPIRTALKKQGSLILTDTALKKGDTVSDFYDEELIVSSNEEAIFTSKRIEEKLKEWEDPKFQRLLTIVPEYSIGLAQPYIEKDKKKQAYELLSSEVLSAVKMKMPKPILEGGAKNMSCRLPRLVNKNAQRKSKKFDPDLWEDSSSESSEQVVPQMEDSNIHELPFYRLNVKLPNPTMMTNTEPMKLEDVNIISEKIVSSFSAWNDGITPISEEEKQLIAVFGAECDMSEINVASPLWMNALMLKAEQILSTLDEVESSRRETLRNKQKEKAKLEKRRKEHKKACAPMLSIKEVLQPISKGSSSIQLDPPIKRRKKNPGNVCEPSEFIVETIMPFLSLDLKCTLTGVTDLKPSEPATFRWYLKMKCTNCGEAPDHWQYITIDEVLNVPGSRGEANLVEKCKLCNRLNTLTILPDSVGKYEMDKNEKWQSMIVFDCRGIEPVDFDPRIGWQATGVESNQPFDDIDLSEKMWADYDEKVGEAVEISNVEVQFSHYKQKK